MANNRNVTEDFGNFIIVVESGSDIPQDIMEEYNIHTLPMHIIMDERNLDDGTFPIHEIYDFYEQTKRIPKTSAVNPQEYLNLFKKIHEEYPDKKILHLCYSGVTTATWQNALIGSEDMDYVYHIDTKFVSAGQSIVVKKTASYIKEHPEITIDELIPVVEDFVSRAYMMFIPKNLEYLKAGGRVSNAAYLGASILNLKPMIEVLDGYLTANKKYRGSMSKVCGKALKELLDKHTFEKEDVYLMYSEGLEEEIRLEMMKMMKEHGYTNLRWVKTGGVITTHGGPGAFGISVIKEVR